MVTAALQRLNALAWPLLSQPRCNLAATSPHLAAGGLQSEALDALGVSAEVAATLGLNTQEALSCNRT